MTERFPLAPAVTEENRGVDPDVLRDLGYELPFDYVEPTNIEVEEASSSVETDNVVRIGELQRDSSPEIAEEIQQTRRRHPSQGNVTPRLIEMPQRGRNNDPNKGVKFNPDPEHIDAAVIGLSAAREALRNKRNQN
jgi:hypothetical protein